MKEELYRLIRSSGVNTQYAETATEMILAKYTLTPKSEADFDRKMLDEIADRCERLEDELIELRAKAVGCGRVTINEVGEKDICDTDCPDCEAKQKPKAVGCDEVYYDDKGYGEICGREGLCPDCQAKKDGER